MSLQFNMVYLSHVLTKQCHIPFTYLQTAKHLLLLHLISLHKYMLEVWLYYNKGLNEGQLHTRTMASL